jgi:PAS domain S-box-containing protein
MTVVLIVDDKEDNLYFLQALLTGHGYQVEAARNGAEALEKARAARPGLVIADLLMPVMDGFTLLRHWAADPQLSAVPFVVYTATYTSADDEALALSLGADAFIIKPAEPDELIARIRAVETAAPARPPRGAPGGAPLADDPALVTQYNAVLVRKLEDKMAELEAANAALRAEVAERRRAERAVGELKDRLEAMVGKAGIGILVNIDLRPVMANDALAHLLGYDGQADIFALGDVRLLFDDSERDRLNAAHAAYRQSGEVAALYQVKGRRRDGAVIDMEARSFALPWGAGTAVCSMLTDVTEQRRLEARAGQAQRLEAIGQMTGGIAHDFNNLLSVILGNSELLEEELAGNPDLCILAEVTRKAAQRGADLTRRLLAFSRRQALDPAVVDINALVAGTDDLLRRAVGAQVEIRMRLAPDAPTVLVDAPQLESALVNLSVNARDAMPGGGVLTIETRAVELDRGGAGDLPAGPYVLVSVSDTGTGMDEATRLKAFDPFFTTKGVGRGTGLGLSMVYGFVKQSGGSVQIDSAPGRGTTVRILLPRAGQAARPAAEASPAAQSGTGRHERILVVEDDPLVREQVTLQLQRLGYDVVSACDGPGALEILQRDPAIDLLFTDIVMPGGLNGRQLADRARSLHPDLPILLTSGYADGAVEPDAATAALPLLQKPYQRQELAASLRSLLDGRRALF